MHPSDHIPVLLTPKGITQSTVLIEIGSNIQHARGTLPHAHNLAVIFGPTLMGTDPSKAIADAGWQIKVVDTILQNTYQIFDED